MNESYKQKQWTKFMNKFVSKNCEQNSWTKVLSKSCEQKLWTKVVKKCYEQPEPVGQFGANNNRLRFWLCLESHIFLHSVRPC